jgi:hypothetical protein
VSNRVSRRQAGRWAQQDQQAYEQQQPQQQQPVYAAPAPAAAPETSMDDKLAQLKDLAALKEQGVLTDYEFEAQKARILNN